MFDTTLYKFFVINIGSYINSLVICVYLLRVTIIMIATPKNGALTHYTVTQWKCTPTIVQLINIV